MHGGQASPTRVLVIDDEPSIRLLCRVNLELDGNEVLEAGSLAEARAALSEGSVDVVVLDLNLRGERSGVLIAECHARRPAVPVVLISGSAELADDGPGDADVVLGKPFEIEDLLTSVRDLAAARVRS